MNKKQILHTKQRLDKIHRLELINKDSQPHTYAIECVQNALHVLGYTAVLNMKTHTYNIIRK